MKQIYKNQFAKFIYDEINEYVVKHFAKITYKQDESVRECVIGGFKAATSNQGILIDKNKKENLICNVTTRIEDFLSKEIKNQNEFDKEHAKLRMYTNKQFQNLNDKKNKHRFKGRDGFGQKLINVTFKNLFSASVEVRKNLEFGHMTIDRYILDWLDKNNLISYKLRNYIYDKKGINQAWTKIKDEKYSELQKEIRDKLNKGIKYELIYPKVTITLPKSPIKAEFIIWYEEKIKRKL